MEVIHSMLAWNEILTVSILGWLTAQLIKTTISSLLAGKLHVVAIITMHDAMGVRHETGEQAKVLNNIIEMWLEESETLSPFLQNMRLKEMVGHTPLQVYAGMIVGAAVGFLYPLSGVIA